MNLPQWGVHLVAGEHSRDRPTRHDPQTKRARTSLSASRGEQGPDLAPPRADAPRVKTRRIGGMPEDLRSEVNRREAMQELIRDMYAPSMRRVVEVKIRTVGRALGFWGLELLPPTVETIHALGATLKRGGYRSAASYLSLYKGFAERAGYEFSAPLSRAVRDAIRSCERGQGGSVKALALPFERLVSLPLTRSAWVAGGPTSPRNAIVAGSWFLMRELELSTARANAVTIDASTVRPTVRWALPVSKADPRALGIARVHGCSCGPVPRGGCPAHAMWDQLIHLRRTFPRRFGADGRPDADLPLFPNARGEFCEKDAMVATIVHAARVLGVPTETADGSERVSGHSLRVTGAQGLARLGLDLWAIQLLGRWGSDRVKGYVRQVQLEHSAEWAASAARKTELEQVVRDILAKVQGQPPAKDTLRRASEGVVASGGGAVGACGAQQDGLICEVARAAEEAKQASIPPGSDTLESGDAEKRAVVNSATGTWHKVLVGPPHNARTWLTRCGWSFGSKQHVSEPGTAVPEAIDKLCQRCFGALRLELKAKAAGAVRRQEVGAVP